MKIPLLWLKDYVKTDKSAKKLAESFTQLGLMLDKQIDGNVLDLEHRMDRSDWLSILGCARDLAAFENIPLTLPKIPLHKPHISAQPIPITVQTPFVRRFQTRVFRGIKVGPSPAWLSKRLAAYGIDPVNNIVDITNFVMVEYGQTSHAQDIAKLPSTEITLRPARAGEKLTTLLGTTVSLTPDEFVLSSGGEAIVIGGIVGGLNTAVTKDTTDIILDAGSYDSRAIRKSSRRLKIINESVSRNDKILNSHLIDPVMDRLTDLILTHAGGTYYANDDYYPHPPLPKNQTLTLARLKLISGLDISLSRAKKILRSLEYAIIEENELAITVEIPYFRTDVEVEDDLIADILRINNYANLPATPLSTSVPLDITPPIYSFEEQLRDLLVAQGLHEHITNSLTTWNGESGQIKLANAISNDQNALRTSLLPGLSHVQTTYSKHKLNSIGIFEIGLVFTQEKNRYLEHRHLSTISDSAPSILSTLLHSLGISNYLLTNSGAIKHSTLVLGSYTPTSFTLFIEQLSQLQSPMRSILSEFSHPTTLDLSLIAPNTVSFADIQSVSLSLPSHWSSMVCKAFAIIKNSRNYLLTITWSENTTHVESDKSLLLSTLNKNLGITSKS